MLKNTSLLICFLSFRCIETFAASGPSDTLLLYKEVLIQAQRMKTSLNEVSGSVTVLKSNELQAPLARTLPEAMMGQTGLHVQRTNLGGGSVFMRGLTGNQILLVVDGIRMNNAIYRYGPNQYLNTISLFDVAQVECYRGSGSVWYGSDALGGTVNILTKTTTFSEKPTWKPTAEIRLETPSDAQSVAAGIACSTKKFSVDIGGALRNFSDVRPGNGMPLQSPSGYKEHSAQWKLRWIQGKSEWIIAHKWLQQNNIPLFYRYQLESYQQYMTDVQGNTLNYIRNIYRRNSTLTRTITLAYASQWEQRSLKKKTTDPLTTEFDRVNSIHLNTEWQKEFGTNWQLLWCIELYRDLVQSSRSKTDASGNTISIRGLYPEGATMFNGTGAFMLRKKSKQWDFNAGIRTGINRLNFPGTVNVVIADSITLPEPPVSLNQGVYALSAHLGKKWKNTYWFSTLNTGYRNPNIDDMGTLGLVDIRYERPAFNLKPERNVMLEMGMHAQSPRWKFNWSAYSNQLFGLISRVKVPDVSYKGYAVYEKVNSGRASVYGLEASASWFPLKNLEVLFNGSWQKGRIILPNQEPMRRIPPLNGSCAIAWNRKKWNLEFELMGHAKQHLLAPGDIDDVRIGPNGTPAWIGMNAWFGIALPRGGNISVSIQNITNAFYKTHGSGICMPGRNLRLLMHI